MKATSKEAQTTTKHTERSHIFPAVPSRQSVQARLSGRRHSAVAGLGAAEAAAAAAEPRAALGARGEPQRQAEAPAAEASSEPMGR